MNNEYYYEEDYPDCIGNEYEYQKQPGCLTCIYKNTCYEEIKQQDAMTEWEAKYDY